MRENKSYVARIIFNYQNLLDEKIIQEGYLVALDNWDAKMFNSIYNKSEIGLDSKIEPNSNILGIIKQLSKQKGGKRFSELLKKFE